MPTKTRKYIDVKSFARSYTRRAIEILGGIAEKSTDDAVRVAAANSILNRGWGKPAQTQEITGKEGGTIEIIVRHIGEGSKAPQR
jgi:hypothetical protein